MKIVIFNAGAIAAKYFATNPPSISGMLRHEVLCQACDLIAGGDGDYHGASDVGVPFEVAMLKLTAPDFLFVSLIDHYSFTEAAQNFSRYVCWSIGCVCECVGDLSCICEPSNECEVNFVVNLDPDARDQLIQYCVAELARVRVRAMRQAHNDVVAAAAA